MSSYYDDPDFADEYGRRDEQAILDHIAEVGAAQDRAKCPHDDSEGVDQAPFGQQKVWRCRGCGFVYRNVECRMVPAGD